MGWNRIDITGVAVEFEQLVAEVQDTEHPLSAATILARASALLGRARGLPELALDTGMIPTTSGWQGARYVAGNGVIEISCWKEEVSGLLQGEWQGDKQHSLFILVGERTWMSDAAYPEGWSFDPEASIEIIEKAGEMSEVREKAERIVALWEEKQHPKQGWICSHCGWQNPAGDPVCTVCQAPAHLAGPTIIGPWATLGGTPPPTFATAPGSERRRDGLVELDAPPEIQGMINQLADKVKGELTGKVRDRVIDALKEKAERPQQCWRCKTELWSRARYCDKCGADQQDAPSVPPMSAKPPRPTNLPE
jgi:hypothetical protein